MAATDTTTASAATDVVCVLNAALEQVFVTARPIKATVKEGSKLMQHPLETGSLATDHRVFLSTEIELSLLLTGEEYRATFQQIRDLYRQGEVLTVQTRAASYPDMLVEVMPHDETPDIYDGLAVAVKLIEARFVEPQFSDIKPANPANASTVKRGEQQPKTSAQEPRKGSILSGVFR